MNLWQQFLWVIYPYLAVAVFVVGHLYRYASDPYGWTARSSEFLEKRLLRWGSTLFHWGILLVFLGHLAGLLVPAWLYRSLGVSDALYHRMAVTAGGLAGATALAGLLLLAYRRLRVARVRRTSSPADWVALALLALVMGLGLYNTLGHNLLVAEYDYRFSIGPWLRGLLLFRPDPRRMAGVPLGYQLHVLAAFALLAAWPFTRLVHVWSLPLPYLWRRYVLYRRRAPGPSDARANRLAG